MSQRYNACQSRKLHTEGGKLHIAVCTLGKSHPDQDHTDGEITWNEDTGAGPRRDDRPRLG